MNAINHGGVAAGPGDVLAGGGEMGALMRAVDWSRTPIGPVERWPQSLRTALSILLETHFPMYIAWGADFTQFYNDGYRPILGSTKHPAAMGLSTRQTFAEIWHIIGPMFEGVMQGRAVGFTDFMLPLDRHGFVEECYFIFSYSPIRDESGGVGGVLVTVTETTERVFSERRLRTLQTLGERTADVKTDVEACRRAAEVLEQNAADLPFTRIYLVDGAGRRATLAGSSGAFTADGAPQAIDLDGGTASPWPIGRVLGGGGAELIEDLQQRLAVRAPAAGEEPRPRAAAVLPIARAGDPRPAGVLVAGISPRQPFDDKYRAYLELISSQVATAVTSARAYEEERKRAQALAEIDRAKTAFFSNVSHEFRTPLTLMLGPAEDALGERQSLPPADVERWQLVQRNGLRLAKLVNTLLDFARLEAGRIEASFEPTDLPALTRDLASTFRSAIDRAGLRLTLDTPPLPAPVYVDRDMWEKIVFNLLSNALKFTLEGEIAVAVRADGDHVELEVRDTGVGIPAAEIPRLFERFHRVKGTRARTHEGTGIGLALVKELARLHGGSVAAASVAGQGTTFTVRVPAGSAHLPPERIAAGRTLSRTTAGPSPFVEEALRWSPEAAAPPPPAAAVPREERRRVLVADDNADMLDYVSRILVEAWEVETAADGDQALRAARRRRPDLVLADVMMPNLDGFGLVRAMRADAALADVPIILLSARAGEEATAEGLLQGANDYLIKPFSARELITRVAARLELARAQQVIKQRAEAERRRLHSFLMEAPAAIAVLRGPELVYELANDRYQRMVGKRDMVGKPGRVALPELSAQGIWDIFDRIYATGEPVAATEFPVQLARSDGGALEQGYFNWVGQPTRGEAGEIDGIMLFAVEVTEQVRARREIEEARGTERQLRQAAEEASRAKDEFLAMLGHELRNPLAPIVTALHLMRLRGTDRTEKERTIVERQVRHLTRLVDDLLDISRITRGKVELKRRPLDLSEVVASAIETVSPLIELRRQHLTIEVPRQHLVVDADPMRLAQVVSNLLTNAAKYTEPEGHITVTAERAGAWITLVVRDTGVGITPDMLPRVFDLFVQERQAADRSQGGLGLGLAIVRSLVALHGGSVEARSEGAGRGSEFLVRLPAAEAAAEAVLDPAARAPATDARAAARVLVVDDNGDAAEMLAEALNLLGYSARVAHDGPSALELVERFDPQVVLLDIGLPVMDGYEVARRLRERPAPHRPRLVAITGYGQEADAARSRAAGFDAHLVKPVDPERLRAMLGQLVSPG